MKSQNDTIVGLKIYNQQGLVTFDKTTQIIEDWDNDLMSWMTANFYENNKIITSYYAHSNLTLNKTIYDYDAEHNLRETYTVSVSNPLVRKRNPYKEIYLINNPDTLKNFIENRLIRMDTLHKEVKAEREKTKFFKSYKDENDLFTKEFWITIDSFQTTKTVEKYNENGRLVSVYTKSRYNEKLIEFDYDENGNLIEEIENWDLKGGKFQRKKHIYNDGNLVKTDFYHGEELAFTYEYFYKDTLLIKEIITRLTNAESFQNRKRREVIEYDYKYY